MHIGTPPPPLEPAADLASALRTAAERFGHRPAVTVLRADRREEQGFASLFQWAAKGAHLFEVDLMLEPGDRVGLVGPVGWLPAAVCLAAWWAGLTVTIGTPGDVTVVHGSSTAPSGGDVLWYGDRLDGTPAAPTTGDAYAVAVQSFPDQPPPPAAAGDHLALDVDGRTWTQRELIDAAGRWGLDGPIGVADAVAPTVWVPAVAVRPLRAGRPTVVLLGADRAAASGEGVRRWID